MKSYTRQQAIAALRRALQEWAGDEHSLCWIAARKHALCRGFEQWTFDELKERFPQIVRTRPGISREEFEDLADRWQLARQVVLDVPLACDAQQVEFKCKMCGGWDEFSDEEVARFHREFCGEAIAVTPEACATAAHRT
jgi:hypothetical protein